MPHIPVNFVSCRNAYVEEILAHQFDLLPNLPVQATHLVFVYEENSNRQSHHSEQFNFQRELAGKLRLTNISLESQSSSEARYEGSINGIDYRFRWEEHSTFFSYTFLRFGTSSLPAVECLASVGASTFPGLLLAAIDIRLENTYRKKGDIAAFLDCSSGDLYGSLVFNHLAEVWSSMKVPYSASKMIVLGNPNDCSSEFNRILIQRSGTNQLASDSAAAGRLLDTLIELETYRILSSYDLSESKSREIFENLAEYEREAQEMIGEIARPGSPIFYCKKLADLADRWAKIERLISGNASKLTAADAYDDLVSWYLDMLGEENISGQQVTLIGLPMRRMIRRSKHACQTIGRRLENLSQHVDRTSDLLRTRMDVSFQFMALPLAIIVASYYISDFFVKVLGDLSNSNIWSFLGFSVKVSQLVEAGVFFLLMFFYLGLPRAYRSYKYPGGIVYRLLGVSRKLFRNA